MIKVIKEEYFYDNSLQEGYFQLASRTESGIDKGDAHRLSHAAMGISSELGEFFQAVDRVNLAEEIGDMYWYCAILHNLSDISDGRVEDIEKYEETFRTAYNETKKNPQLGITLVSSDLSDYAKRVEYYGKPREWSVECNLRCRLEATLQALCCHVDCKPWGIQKANIAKLRSRYGEKFSSKAALNIDTATEWNILRENLN